ncbi:MAG TPA: pitrilysin family protein [Syntrophomonadaceae bacterium]|nr:pitrilysin family protein [Syntrophomonadaceae bacterium]
MIQNWNLQSGARLVVEEIPHVKSAAIGLFIGLGSRHEEPHLAGASHFIEHMLFKGTETRPAREIAESFESIGGQLNAFTSREYTCLYARTLDEDIFSGMDIIFDMLFHSQFAPRDFAVEKDVIAEEINMYEDAPDELIHDVFLNQLWQGHSMGRPILGTLDSVANFDRDQVFDFYQRCYMPSNMVIAVAGNVDRERVRERVEEYLALHKCQKVELPGIQPSPYKPFIQMVDKDTEQVQICLGAGGMSYHDEARFTLNVMNSILGGGISSRLFQSIREELGLAYSVYSAPSNYSDTGSFSIFVGTGPTKVARFFEELNKEVQRFTSQGVSDEEVLRTQHLIKSSMYLGLENVINRMNRLGKSLLMYGQVVDVEEVISRIFAVNRDMVGDLANKTLAGQELSLAAIGSAGVLPGVEQEFRRWWRTA